MGHGGRRRDASHSPVLVAALRSEPWRAMMDACWFLAGIAKVFWYDRHLRRRKGRPSVPQVAPAYVRRYARAFVCAQMIC